MNDTKIEFAVQISGGKCTENIRQALSKCKEIQNFEIDEKLGRVVVNTSLPWTQIQDKLEATGRRAVLTGFGGQSVVSMVSSTKTPIKGVVRFSAINKTKSGCIVDGVVDGLSPGFHGFHVHECGDLSEGCQSLGEHYNPHGSPHGSPDDPADKRHVGDLGNIQANDEGRATFRFIVPILNVGDIIGRSVVITERTDDLGRGQNERSLIDGNSGERLACGIIARSAGIFQNYKKICACDGLTLWDERDKPLAGGNRTSLNKNA